MKSRLIITLMALGWVAGCSPPSEPTVDARDAGVANAARRASLPSPGRFTLVLGDSYAFGWQPFKDNSDAGNFSTGYSTLFVARLNESRPNLHAQEVNLSCPGESSATAFGGGCFYTGLGFPLHVRYEGSQAAAANRFLGTHQGQVNPVIIALGSNDVAFMYFIDCNFNRECARARLPGVLQEVSANMDRLLRDVRRLDPDAELLVALESGDPRDPFVTFLVDALATTVARVGKRYDAVLVDTRSVVTVENACATTFLCSDLHDGHQSDLGYRKSSQVFWSASQFSAPARTRGTSHASLSF